MKSKKTYFPIPIPENIKIGDRFSTLKSNQYCDKKFPIGSMVTYLGITNKRDYGECFYRWPRFQFDGDSHKRRILDFKELKCI